MLFVLSLFAVFAVSALLLVFSGTRVYENITEGMESSFSSRTAISFIKKQVDQNNTLGAISIGNIENTSALMLTETIDDNEFVRYIYFYDGYLCELFTKSDIAPKVAAGQRLVELADMSMEQDGNLLHFSVSDHNDSSLTMTLSLL